MKSHRFLLTLPARALMRALAPAEAAAQRRGQPVHGGGGGGVSGSIAPQLGGR